jgi:glutamine amidotransferase
MSNLRDLGLIETLNRCVFEKSTPLLGICLGMQLLTDGSEEGLLPGLGWISGATKRLVLPIDRRLKIPHMGWNQVKPRTGTHADTSLAANLFADTEPEQRYYFVHSYHACCASPDAVLATAEYGYEFAAAIGRGNIVGTQFHPEKSHRYGLRLMNNFARHAMAKSAHITGRTG